MDLAILAAIGAGTGLVLAVAVFLIAPGRTWNQAFALFLFLYAMIRLTEFLHWSLRPIDGLWAGLQGYFALTDDLALLYFVLIFPSPPRWVTSRAIPILFLVAGLFLMIWYAVDHDAYWTPGAPLHFIDYLLTGIAYSVIPLVLVWRARFTDTRKKAMLLVATGLGGWYLVWVTGASIRLLLIGVTYGDARGAPIDGGIAMIYTTGVLVSLVFLLLVFPLLVQVRSVLPASWLGSALVCGVAWVFFPTMVETLVWTWLALGVLIMTYAVLRHQLFDIDLKIKWTINKSTLIGIFVGVFFVSAQIAQAFLTTEYGWAIGGLVAGLLLLAINPLQRFAAHVADTTMPNVQDTPAYRDARRAEMYRATLEEMIADGTVTVKERRALMRLQDQLGLEDSVTNQLEKDLMDKLEGS